MNFNGIAGHRASQVKHSLHASLFVPKYKVS
jgi:hypothetical protein